MANQNIDIVINAKDQASQALKGVESSLTWVRWSIEKNQATFQKMATIWAAAFTALWYSMNRSINSAVDLWESINAVNVVFWAGSNKILEFWEQAARSVGLANSEFNQLSTETGTLLKASWLELDAVADSTIELTKRASDLASVFNTDVDLAMSAINQALRGETEAIRKFGSDVTDASLEQYLFSQGINKTATELTQQEKILYRMEKIMADTNQVTWDFANTSDSLANKQRILAAEMKNTSASFWELLIPIKQAIFDWFVPVLKYVSEFIKENPVLAKNLAIAAMAVTGLVAVLWTLWLIIPAVIAWVWALWTALAFLALNPIGLVITAIAAGIAIGIAIVKNWETIKEKARELWGKIVELYEKWGFLLWPIKTVIDAWVLIYKNWDLIRAWAVKLLKSLANLGKSAKEWGWNMVQMFIDGIKAKVQALKDGILQIATTISDFLWFHSPTKKWPASDSDKWMPNMIKMFADGIYAGVPKIKIAATQLSSKLTESFNESISIEWLTTFLSNVKTAFQSAWTSLDSDISNISNKIKTLKWEVEWLNSQLKTLKQSWKDVESSWREELAKRALAIEEELKNAEIDLIKKKELEQELALATEKAGIDAMQEAREWQAMSESERIIASTKEKQEAIEQEVQWVRILLLEKYKAIEEEEVRMQELKDKKILFENEFQKLFMENATARQTSIDRAIKSMLKLNALSGSVVNYDAGAISGARAQGWNVNAGQAYMVWEKGRELFVPKTSGTIVSNDSLGGSGGITINMGGVTVQNAADENRLIEKMKTMLKQESKAFNLWIA